MKCRNCGSNLNILNNTCPYCGTANPHFRKQRENIDRYGMDYEKTKEEVVKKSRHFAGYSVRITLIAVLAFLNVLFLLLGLYSWDIQYWLQEREVEKMAGQHREALEEYERNFDYIGLYSYFNAHDLHYSDSLEDFYKVSLACSSFTYLFEDLVMLGQEGRYETDEERIEYIGNHLDTLYECLKPEDYDLPSYYEGNHGKMLERMEADVQALLITYANITQEEAESFPEMSDGRRQVAIERGLGLSED